MGRPKPRGTGGRGGGKGGNGSRNSKREISNKEEVVKESKRARKLEVDADDEEDSSTTTDDNSNSYKAPPADREEQEEETGKQASMNKEAEEDVAQAAKLQQENDRLRKKLKKMEDMQASMGGDGKLNTLQVTQLGTFVKETLFRKVKFVDARKLDSSSPVMVKCFTSIGLKKEEWMNYSLDVKKYLRHYLSQRRNYVSQKVKKCVIGKYLAMCWNFEVCMVELKTLPCLLMQKNSWIRRKFLLVRI